MAAMLKHKNFGVLSDFEHSVNAKGPLLMSREIMCDHSQPHITVVFDLWDSMALTVAWQTSFISI